jgi:hypothetical protein
LCAECWELEVEYGLISMIIAKSHNSITNVRLEVAYCVINYQKTIDTKWRITNYQMPIVYKPLGLKRWV